MLFYRVFIYHILKKLHTFFKAFPFSVSSPSSSSNIKSIMLCMNSTNVTFILTLSCSTHTIGYDMSATVNEYPSLENSKYCTSACSMYCFICALSFLNLKHAQYHYTYRLDFPTRSQMSSA